MTMRLHPGDTPVEIGSSWATEPGCVFCAEIQDPQSWPHAAAYDSRARITMPTASLRVLPTLGQLVPGSLLLLPTRHVERYADLDSSHRAEALETARAIVSGFEAEGSGWVMFEHGALAPGGGGCGLYHAHLHLVPLDAPPSAAELLPTGRTSSGLAEGWDLVDTEDDYLICASSDGTARFRSVAADERPAYPSQFFRRQLHHHLGLDGPWDWREFDQPEPAIQQWIQQVLVPGGI